MSEDRHLIKVGEAYYNPRRGNCLRVHHVYMISVQDLRGASKSVEYAACLSWRPNGKAGSQTLKISTDSLASNYEKVLKITVQTKKGVQEWRF